MWVLIKKNVILPLNNYLMPPYIFPELHTGNGKTLNSATFFLSKSDTISLETSWLLRFEIWSISVSINCNFFRYVNQVSHRNSHSHFSCFWHGMKSGIFLPISLYRYEPNFNSILGTEIKSYGGAYPIPSSNHLCSTHNRLSDFLRNLVPSVQF